VSSATHIHAAQHTWAEFVDLGDDDRRELIDGELKEIDVPTELHEWVVAVLVRLLGNWAADHGGMVLGSGYKIRVREDRGVMPDAQFYRRGNVRGHDPSGLTEGAPDLVVEVVSSSSRRYDRVTKLAWYAELGIAEYWIVDPEPQTLERLLLDGGTYRIAEALEGKTVLSPASFPGLVIHLAALWALPE
jgi:Uma2 family endonuclease